MTEATEAKAKVIIQRISAQLDDHLAALLRLAGRDGCTVVINITPDHNTAIVDFQPPKKRIRLN
jgi:hypothetical protein